MWVHYNNQGGPHTSLGSGIAVRSIDIAERLPHRHAIPADHEIRVRPIPGDLDHDDSF